jgi:hypothetical protein
MKHGETPSNNALKLTTHGGRWDPLWSAAAQRSLRPQPNKSRRSRRLIWFLEFAEHSRDCGQCGRVNH